MNMRRLSYGLLATLAGAALIIGCESTPPADAPPQPTGAPADTGSPAQSATADAPTPPPPPPEPPPPPPKPAKEKLMGNFGQEFAGDLASIAEEMAKKAGGKKGDQKKIDAALEKSKANFAKNNSMIEIAGDTLTWKLKGKAAHTIKFEASGDDPKTVTLKLGKDGKKDLKGQEVAITFTDDDTFEMVDPFPKGKAKALKLVFKRK
jgi:plastocyanin